MSSIKLALRRAFWDFPKWLLTLAAMAFAVGGGFYLLAQIHLYFQGSICQ